MRIVSGSVCLHDPADFENEINYAYLNRLKQEATDIEQRKDNGQFEKLAIANDFQVFFEKNKE